METSFSRRTTCIVLLTGAVQLNFDIYTYLFFISVHYSGHVQPKENVFFVTIFNVRNSTVVWSSSAHFWFEEGQQQRITSKLRSTNSYIFFPFYNDNSYYSTREIEMAVLLSILSGGTYLLVDRYHLTAEDVGIALSLLQSASLSHIKSLAGKFKLSISSSWKDNMRKEKLYKALFPPKNIAKNNNNNNNNNNHNNHNRVTGMKSRNETSRERAPSNFVRLIQSIQPKTHLLQAGKLLSIFLFSRVFTIANTGRNKFGSLAIQTEPILRQEKAVKSVIYGPRITLDPTKAIMGDSQPTLLSIIRSNDNRSNRNRNKISQLANVIPSVVGSLLRRIVSLFRRNKSPIME